MKRGFGKGAKSTHTTQGEPGNTFYPGSGRHGTAHKTVMGSIHNKMLKHRASRKSGR